MTKVIKDCDHLQNATKKDIIDASIIPSKEAKYFKISYCFKLYTKRTYVLPTIKAKDINEAIEIGKKMVNINVCIFHRIERIHN